MELVVVNIQSFNFRKFFIQVSSWFSCFFYCFEKKREEYLVHQKKSCNFAGAKKKRKVGRVIDRAGLEIRYTLFGYRGFESLTFRKERRSRNRLLLSFFGASLEFLSEIIGNCQKLNPEIRYYYWKLYRI